MADRIKGIRKKLQNGYSNLTPFGTDGKLVDMASGLHLEEEIVLGGSCDTSIEYNVPTGEGQTATVIIQKYYVIENNIENEEEEEDEESLRRYTYSLKTVISDLIDHLILVGKDPTNDENLYLSEDQTNAIVERDATDRNDAYIEEYLYQGKYKDTVPVGETQAKLLHMKRITIHKGTTLEDQSESITEAISDSNSNENQGGIEG